jgi:hypothetical protein
MPANSLTRLRYWHLLVLLGGLSTILLWSYLCGNQAFAFVDIASDTFLQFYPWHEAVAHQVRHTGLPTWSFELGLGGYLGTSLDPFWLLGALVPDDAQLRLRVFVFMAKILGAGSFFYLYLRTIGLREVAAVVGGLGYAFSGYLTINGLWDPHGTETLQLAVYLLLLEYGLCRPFFWPGLVAGLTIGVGQTFNIYTFSLFSMVYLIARSGLGLRPDLRQLLRFVLSGVAGMMLMAPLQLPGIYYLLENPRVSGSHSALIGIFGHLFDTNDRATLGAEIFGLLGKNLLGVADKYQGWTNYLEGPGFYVGLPALLFAPQLVSPGSTPRQRRLLIIAAIGCALYFIFPSLRFAVYGFGHIAFRLSTLWISALILVTGMFGLQRVLVRIWWPGLIASAVLIIALAGYAMAAVPAADSRHAETVVALVLAYLILLAAWQRRAAGEWLAPALIAVFCVELVLLTGPSLAPRNSALADGSSAAGSYEDGTEAAVAALKERLPGEFYRIEKGYQSVFLDDALAQHYFGVKSYAFHGSALTRLVDGLQWRRPVPSVSYIAAPLDRPLVLDVLAVRYLLSHGRGPEGTPGLTYVGSTQNVDIYERTTAWPLATLHDTFVTDAQMLSGAVEERDRLFHSAVALADLAAVREVVPGSPGTATDDKVSMQLNGSARLTGTATLSRAQFLLLAIPYDAGWNFEVDGKSATLQQADLGLMGAVLPAGKHDLQLRFRAPGQRIGIGFAIASALIVLVAFLPGRRRKPTPSA